MQTEYDIVDTTGLTYLSTGWRHYDRMEEARVAIAKEGAVITDRFGQKKPHPSTLIERDASAAMLRAFRALNLDVIQPHDKPGRPPGR